MSGLSGQGQSALKRNRLNFMSTQPNGRLLETVSNFQTMLRTLEIEAHNAGISYDLLLMTAKRQFIIGAIARNKGNKCKAAADLKMHRNTLNRTVIELKIDLVQMGLKRRRGGLEA